MLFEDIELLLERGRFNTEVGVKKLSVERMKNTNSDDNINLFYGKNMKDSLNVIKNVIDKKYPKVTNSELNNPKELFKIKRQIEKTIPANGIEEKVAIHHIKNDLGMNKGVQQQNVSERIGKGTVYAMAAKYKGILNKDFGSDYIYGDKDHNDFKNVNFYMLVPNGTVASFGTNGVDGILQLNNKIYFIENKLGEFTNDMDAKLTRFIVGSTNAGAVPIITYDNSVNTKSGNIKNKRAKWATYNTGKKEGRISMGIKNKFTDSNSNSNSNANINTNTNINVNKNKSNGLYDEAYINAYKLIGDKKYYYIYTELSKWATFLKNHNIKVSVQKYGKDSQIIQNLKEYLSKEKGIKLR